MAWFNKNKKTAPTLAKSEIGVPTEESGKKVGAKTTKTAYNPAILKRVWITEKSTDLGGLRKYTFLADKKANANEVKKAIEGIYNVSIGKINIINFARRRQFRGKFSGVEKYKKAIVTLQEGQELDVIPK